MTRSLLLLVLALSAGCSIVKRYSVVDDWATVDRAWLPLHHLQVHQDFTRALLGAEQLIALEVHQAHILGLQRTFAD